jgi:hypothetical protein
MNSFTRLRGRSRISITVPRRCRHAVAFFEASAPTKSSLVVTVTAIDTVMFDHALQDRDEGGRHKHRHCKEQPPIKQWAAGTREHDDVGQATRDEWGYRRVRVWGIRSRMS